MKVCDVASTAVSLCCKEASEWLRLSVCLGSLWSWWVSPLMGGGVVFSSGLLVNNLLHKLCPILLQQSHATVIRWTGEADHSKQRMRQLNDGTITHVDCARRKRDSGSPNATINLRPMPEAQRERKTRLLLLLCIFLR